MAAETGQQREGVAHLRQSIRDILTTPVGSRVMLRDYGSELPRLVDRPMNDALLVDIYAAIATALGRWEPRLQLQGMSVEDATPGAVTVALRGIYVPDGRAVALEGIQL